jgi:hypothetical protein
MGIYTDRLNRMQKTMDEQMKDYVPGGFSILPEGEYSARVQATLDSTKKPPSRLMVTWAFTVAEGDKMGRKVFDRTIIEDNKVGAQICRGRLEDLGHKWPVKVALLESVLETITANPPLVSVQVSHEKSKGDDGKEYTNARIRIIDVMDVQPGEETIPISSQTIEDPTLSGLLALCGSYQLEYVTDDMDVEAIKIALKEKQVTFKEEDLQPEELAVLESVDPEFIERKAAPVPVRKVAPKAAVVKGKR